MTDRKFTPPTEFPAEYVDGNGDKAVILGRGPHKVFPFIGHNAAGYARYWTEKGTFSSLGINGFDLHDIPKRIDEREDWDALQEVTAELEQAEARIKELEDRLAKAVEALEGVRSFTRDLGLYADQGHTLAPALRKACNTLTELKGETEWHKK